MSHYPSFCDLWIARIDRLTRLYIKGGMTPVSAKERATVQVRDELRRRIEPKARELLKVPSPAGD